MGQELVFQSRRMQKLLPYASCDLLNVQATTLAARVQHADQCVSIVHSLSSAPTEFFRTLLDGLIEFLFESLLLGLPRCQFYLSVYTFTEYTIKLIFQYAIALLALFLHHVINQHVAETDREAVIDHHLCKSSLTVI